MSFRFRRKECPRDATVRIVREQSRLVVEHLSAPTDQALHVHAARQALKKLRGLLRLVRNCLPEPVYREALHLCRDTAQAVAEVRDAAATQETFDDQVSDALPLEATALAQVRAALASRAVSGGERDWQKQVARFYPALTDLPDLLDAAKWRGQRWAPLGAGFRRCYRHGRAAMRQAQTHPSSERFHDWRKRVKDRWYQMLLLRNLWKPVMTALAEELKKLSDLLGQDHDLAVLKKHLAELPAHELSEGLREMLLERISAQQDEIRNESRRLGQCLYAEKAERTARRMGAYWKAWRKRRPPQEHPEVPSSATCQEHKR